MGRRKPTKVVERPKTRKELRKDKRLQKKANRVHFHKRKKELKIEYRERLKQQKRQGGGKKGAQSKRDADEEADESDEQQENENDDVYDQADMSSGNESDDPNVRGSNDSDEEIESDFELSDEELELKFAGRVKPNAATTKKTKKMAEKPSERDRFDADLLKEKQKQHQLQKEMRKQRVKQLRAANEEEDKEIRRLEKQLKIDKKRSEKHVPTMFNDGLEYALELCLPESIQKMYTAAKEAAENEVDSDTGFEEDLAMAMGEQTNGKASKKRKPTQTDGGKVPQNKKAKLSEEQKADAARSAHKMAKLRQAESKYFDSGDDFDSDLGDVDSEFEQDEDGSDDEVVEVHKANKMKKGAVQDKYDEEDNEEDAEEDDELSEDDSDFGIQDDENDFEDDESDSDDEEDASDGEGPEEVHKSKKSKSAAQKKRTVEEDSEVDESDEDDEPQPPSKKKGKANQTRNDAKSGKKSAKPDADDFGDEDDDFDEDVFGLSSGDETDDKASEKRPDVWEDIYGRTRDKDGNVITVSIQFFNHSLFSNASQNKHLFYLRQKPTVPIRVHRPNTCRPISEPVSPPPRLSRTPRRTCTRSTTIRNVARNCNGCANSSTAI